MSVLVVGLRERDTGRLIFSQADEFSLEKGNWCLVESQLGLDLARVVTSFDSSTVDWISKVTMVNLVRKATADDLEKVKEISALESEALAACRDKILKHDLSMKLIKVKYLFDQSKAIFFFTSEARVDFRDLVRDLASTFRCRIEMKQVGVRDEARMVGGIGCCGRLLCCTTFLRDFETVTIKMAKEQGLTLIPSKISGMCGRLMCCLVYEYLTYRDVNKRIPKLGRTIETSMGPGKIRHVNAIRETATIELEDGQRVDVAIPPHACDEVIYELCMREQHETIEFDPFHVSLDAEVTKQLRQNRRNETVDEPRDESRRRQRPRRSKPRTRQPSPDQPRTGRPATTGVRRERRPDRPRPPVKGPQSGPGGREGEKQEDRSDAAKKRRRRGRRRRSGGSDKKTQNES
ncbi:stage 0 sporulation protein [bacterium]|nr:stage 0 sporulation protein [candidate division CSSED10-310 bacterium]